MFARLMNHQLKMERYGIVLQALITANEIFEDALKYHEDDNTVLWDPKW